MDSGAIDAIFIILSSLGGIAAVIGAAGWTRAERIRAERMGAASDAAQDSAVLTELKALRKQMAEMHSTSHQFDISFDEALGRLEERVSRVETKGAVISATPPQTEEAQHVGLR